MLHPLLTATQEGNYIGTENIGAIPFHRRSCWRTRTRPNGRASGQQNNEAFIDRICVIKVPYLPAGDRGAEIYEKLIPAPSFRPRRAHLDIGDPGAFSVMSRLRKHDNSTIFAKMRVSTVKA